MSIVEKVLIIISIVLLGVGIIIAIRDIYFYYHPAELTSFPLAAIVLGHLALIGLGEIGLFLIYAFLSQMKNVLDRLI